MNGRTQPNAATPTFSWWDSFNGTIDRVIYAVAPGIGAQRMEFRRRYKPLMDRPETGTPREKRDEFFALSANTFEGAAGGETRGSSWIGSRLSADSALESDLATLRTRSRELYRNDSIGGVVDTMVNQVVGVGFRLQSLISHKIVGKEAADFFRAELEAIYERWAPGADVSGRISLWQITRLIARHLKFDGEGLAVMSDDDHPDRILPLAIEVIDPERLETPPEHSGNPLVRLGIEKNERGHITHYWIRRTHPGDTLDTDLTYDRVPAHRVVHVFERWFAGQTRGLPWLCRTLNRLKDIKDLDDAELIKLQVQSCFAVFVRPASGQPGQVVAENSASGTRNGVRYEDVRPGAIHYGQRGDEVDIAAPAGAGNDYASVQEWNYRRVAAALNVPYEVVAKNWDGLSFAGGRVVLADLKLDVSSQQKLVVEQLLTPIYHRFVDECVYFGKCSIEPRNWANRPWIYHAHRWASPVWSYEIIPGETLETQLKAVDANVTTLEKIIGESGEDQETIFAQRGREIGRQIELNILAADKAGYTPPPPAAESPAMARKRKEEELAALGAR